MEPMVVTAQSAHRCCSFCYADFGHSKNTKAKTRLRRTLKRSERQSWKRDLRRG